MNQSIHGDEARWRAVLERSPQADGLFYYAVATTGIFCRPTCPSRRPRREHVRFFDTAAEAAEAGYRPCRRCRPTEISSEQRVVAQVQQLIQQADEAPSLAELGGAVGLSPGHLQRLFKRATGLSPREYASLTRMERLKDDLRRGASVTDALYGAGFGSSRSLYESASRHLGMTPGAYRAGGAGQRIVYACADTSLGKVLVAATERGLCALRFGDDEAALVAELAAEFPRATLSCDAEVVAPYVAAVQAHLAGENRELALPLDLEATAFQLRVWEALRAIPYGQVRSYTEIAKQIGQPTAVRAVARACATNPVALVIPCHRVLRSTGELAGYRWGLQRKRALLEHERSRAEESGRVDLL